MTARLPRNAAAERSPASRAVHAQDSREYRRTVLVSADRQTLSIGSRFFGRRSDGFPGAGRDNTCLFPVVYVSARVRQRQAKLRAVLPGFPTGDSPA